MTLSSRPVIVSAAAVVAATAVAAGCGAAALPGVAPPASRPAAARTAAGAPPRTALRGEAARVATAVRGFGVAVRDGDVERLCRPGAIFTGAVVDEMGSGGVSCEAYVEELLATRRPPPAEVVAVSVTPGLATARVRANRSRTVPLTLVREGRRWLISFSDGTDPLGALTG